VSSDKPKSILNINLYIQPLETCLAFSRPLILYPSLSCQATSCPVSLSTFVLYFHVRHFQRLRTRLALIPARQPGTRFRPTYAGGMEGWVDLRVGCMSRWLTRPQTVTHPSSKHLLASLSEVEPATSQSEVCYLTVTSLSPLEAYNAPRNRSSLVEKLMELARLLKKIKIRIRIAAICFQSFIKVTCTW